MAKKVITGVSINSDERDQINENFTELYAATSLVGVTASIAELNIMDGVGATTAEINAAADASSQLETIVAAGALSVSLKFSDLALVGAGAVTLGVPSALMKSQIKTITMTVDNGDVTMALTNVNNVAGASAGTTCTFDAVGDCLILAACGAKWVVVGISGAAIT